MQDPKDPKNIDTVFIIVPEDSKTNMVYFKNKRFSKKEDDLLKRIVSQFGPRQWKSIATFLPGRTFRQCRDRYMNYLAPGISHTEWTTEEDRIVYEKYNLFGPQWTKIGKFLPTRTPNDIKIRYKCTISRKTISDFQTPNQKIDIIPSIDEFLNKLEFRY